MYQRVSKSAIRAVVDLVADLQARGLLQRPVTVVDMDGHASIAELPAGDVIGVGSINMTDRGSTWEVTGSVTVLTLDDEGVNRLKTLADRIGRRLRPESQFPLYDPESGIMVGTFVVKDGTETTPVARAEVRNAISVVFSGEVVPSPAFS